MLATQLQGPEKINTCAFPPIIVTKTAFQMDLSSFDEIYDEWESRLTEERYVHQDFQCDSCHKVPIPHRDTPAEQ